MSQTKKSEEKMWVLLEVQILTLALSHAKLYYNLPLLSLMYNFISDR